jgi:hypothetical protein
MGEAEYIAHKGETRGAYRILVGRSEGNNALGMPRMDLQAVRWGGIVWIDLAHDRNGGGFF